jgi:hypothetical protein
MVGKIEVKSLALDDRRLFESYLAMNDYINSEYSFATWFSWKGLFDYGYAVIENCLCVFGRNSGWEIMNFPLGEAADVKRALLFLLGEYERAGKKLIIVSVSDEMMGTLREIGLLDRFAIENKRDLEDYIYRRENFIGLAGKKLHSKRNHYNYFCDTYEATMEPLTDALVPECRKMLAAVIGDRSLSPDDEMSTTNVLMRNREALGLKGNVLFVDGVPAGVILGEQRGKGKNRHVLIHIAKADVTYRGASVALFKIFLEENFVDCELVNLMDDMGIEGLRRSKSSYNPLYLAEYNVLTQL